MPLFSTERKREEKELEREVRLKQGIGRLRPASAVPRTEERHMPQK